jgi:hypothetical protein
MKNKFFFFKKKGRWVGTKNKTKKLPFNEKNIFIKKGEAGVEQIIKIILKRRVMWVGIKNKMKKKFF